MRLVWDPSAPGQFQWFGVRMDRAREIERRWHDDGLIGDESSFLAVAAGEAGDEACAGGVGSRAGQWRDGAMYGLMRDDWSGWAR